jgi:NADPH2:quinone reductase
MPFILRGVSLLGASSNNCTPEVRREMWQKLAGPWKPRHLDAVVTRTVGLRDLVLAAEDLLHRKIHGRVVVEIRQ